MLSSINLEECTKLEKINMYSFRNAFSRMSDYVTINLPSSLKTIIQGSFSGSKIKKNY